MTNIIMLKSTTYFQINQHDWISEGQKICLETVDGKHLNNVRILSICSENYSICVTDDTTCYDIYLQDIISLNHITVSPSSLIFLKEDTSFSLDQENYYKEGSYVTIIDQDNIRYERVNILSLHEKPLSITFIKDLEQYTLELENIKYIFHAVLDERVSIHYD